MLLSSCGKLDEPFEVAFYTRSRTMPNLYMVSDGKNYGKIKRFEAVPLFSDSTLTSLITDKRTIRIQAVDEKQNVVANIRFDLKQDGSYKSSGGGYLWYEITQPASHQILVDLSSLQVQ